MPYFFTDRAGDPPLVSAASSDDVLPIPAKRTGRLAPTQEAVRRPNGPAPRHGHASLDLRVQPPVRCLGGRERGGGGADAAQGVLRWRPIHTTAVAEVLWQVFHKNVPLKTTYSSLPNFNPILKASVDCSSEGLRGLREGPRHTVALRSVVTEKLRTAPLLRIFRRVGPTTAGWAPCNTSGAVPCLLFVLLVARGQFVWGGGCQYAGTRLHGSGRAATAVGRYPPTVGGK